MTCWAIDSNHKKWEDVAIRGWKLWSKAHNFKFKHFLFLVTLLYNSSLVRLFYFGGSSWLNSFMKECYFEKAFEFSPSHTPKDAHTHTDTRTDGNCAQVTEKTKYSAKQFTESTSSGGGGLSFSSELTGLFVRACPGPSSANRRGV